MYSFGPRSDGYVDFILLSYDERIRTRPSEIVGTFIFPATICLANGNYLYFWSCIFSIHQELRFHAEWRNRHYQDINRFFFVSEFFQRPFRVIALQPNDFTDILQCFQLWIPLRGLAAFPAHVQYNEIFCAHSSASVHFRIPVLKPEFTQSRHLHAPRSSLSNVLMFLNRSKTRNYIFHNGHNFTSTSLILSRP